MAALQFHIPYSAQERHLYLVLNFSQLIFSQLPDHFALAAAEDSDLPLRPWLEGLREALEPRRSDISHFFTPSFSLPEALLSLIPLDQVDVKSWLEAALAQEESSLRQTLLQAAWPYERAWEFLTDEPQLQGLSQGDLVHLIRDEVGIWPSYLRQAGLDAQTSWTLLEILEKPKQYLSAYSALVNSFQFIAEAIVGPRESEALQALTAAFPQLSQARDRLLDLNPSLESFFQAYEGRAIPVMPSLDPLALRLMQGQEVLVMGFAIPDLLRAEEDQLQEDRKARAAFCQTLADPTRYQLCCLLANGQRRQKDLAESLEVSQATISHHLAQLKALGLYKPGKAGGLASESFLYYLQGLAEDLRIYG